MSKTRIVDRSVLEISTYLEAKNFNSKFDEEVKQDIIELIKLMKNLGADLQEINSGTINLLEQLPINIEYVFNVEKKEDLIYIEKYGFDTVIINKNMMEIVSSEDYLNKVNYNNINTILEIYAHNLEIALTQIEELRDRKFLENLKGIKIIGLHEEYPHEIGYNIQKFKNKISYMEKNIDIWLCTVNNSFSATALVVESYDKNTDYITLSFNGFQFETINKWACFEEVVMALNVIYKKEIESSLNLFPQVKYLFQKLTNSIIEDNKPIIGSGIFKCESGIHVDGISKDSATYEPFNPEIIGQKREFILGKHSGSKGVEIKLKELGINFNKEDLSNLLDKIRENSILNNGLMDNQIIFKLVGECNL
jgi:homocitrate synthase NifV